MIYYLFILLCLLVFFNQALKRTNWYKNQFVDSKKFLESMPSDIEIVNLGSSQPKFAFDYSESGVVGMNWAVAPQAFEYDFKILKHFRAHLSDGATVLIPVCPFKFFVYRYSDINSNNKYYPFLNSSEILSYSNFRKLMLEHFPIIYARKQLVRIIMDVPLNNDFSLEQNPMDETQIRNNAQNFVKSWKNQFSISDFNNITLSEENRKSIEKNIEIVKSMYDYCIEQNLRPVFILLPSTKELSSYFSNAFIQEYIIANIKKSVGESATVLNYFGDMRFNKDENYINSFLFNKKARIEFTKEVVADLKRISV